MADGAPFKKAAALRSKQQVAQSFSQAASRYDGLAKLQQALGDKLFADVREKLNGIALDVGSGTGVYSLKVAELPEIDQVISLDLAEGMLRYASQQRAHTKISYLQADADNVPLADESVDCIFANLSLQWSEQPEALFAGLERVLKPDGLLVFNTLGPKTLKELRQSWQQVDPYVHVNQFTGIAELTQAMPTNLFADHLVAYETRLTYSVLNDLLTELKGIGASNHNQGRPQGLGGRARIVALKAAYEEHRNAADLLPATYEVVCGIFRKGKQGG